MNRISLLALGFVASVATLDAQALTVSIAAYDNATVQPGGPRTGSNGKAFFNVEGSDNGSFASYGVARFDLAAAKEAFDGQYGSGGWKIDSIILELTQSNAAFSNTGGVGIRHTGDDTGDLQPGASPLAYPVGDDFPDLAALVDYIFVPVSTGALEAHTLYQAGASNGAGAPQLVADVLGDELVTLVFVDLDAAVAATYAGATHSSLAGPTLAIGVSAVPVPAALPLLGSALGLLALRRRR